MTTRTQLNETLSAWLRSGITPTTDDPRWGAWVTWVREQGADLRPLLTDVLRHGSLDEQELAVGALRALGVEVAAEGYDDEMRWVVRGPDGDEVIEPASKPFPPSAELLTRPRQARLNEPD